MKKLKIIITIIFPIFIFGFFNVSNAQAATPVLHFSDLTAGSNIGLGDGLGSGAIVTVWGSNLGSSQGSSQIYIKDSSGTSRIPAHIYYWLNADGTDDGGPVDLYTHHGLQEIAFSVPVNALTGAGKIYVTVDGIDSNELDFYVRNTGNFYYVNAGAGSGGNGSWSNPWNSRDDCHDNVIAGDTCYFMGSTTFQDSYGYQNTLRDGYAPVGTETSPIGWIVYPGENVYIEARENDPTYSGSTASGTNAFRTWPDSGVPNSILNVTWYTFSKWKIKAWNQTFGSGGTGWRIIGNDCDGLNRTTELQAGILGTSGKEGWMLGNSAHGGRSGSKMDHAIYPGGCPSGDRGIVLGWNHIYDNNFDRGPLVSVNSEGTRCHDSLGVGVNEYIKTVTIRNNYIDCATNASRAITIFNMSYETGDIIEPEAYLYNNMIVSCGRIDGNGNHPAAIGQNGHIHYWNNTFFNSHGHSLDLMRRGNSDNEPTLSFDIQNNIFYETENDLLEYIHLDDAYPISPTVANVTVLNNVYYGKGGSYRDWIQDTNNLIDDIGRVETDPLFTNSANSNFTLQSTSPAINTGITLPLVSTDFLGITRPQGSAYDIGAYEYEESGTVIRADVDQSSSINSTDALLTLRNSLGLDMSSTNWQVSATTGDVNCDDSSSSTDALLILRESLGLDMSGTGWCVS